MNLNVSLKGVEKSYRELQLPFTVCHGAWIACMLWLFEYCSRTVMALQTSYPALKGCYSGPGNICAYIISSFRDPKNGQNWKKGVFLDLFTFWKGHDGQLM